jgi:predicted ester cyclase
MIRFLDRNYIIRIKINAKMKEPADANQFINALNSDWNTLYVAGSLTLFALFTLCAALVSANAQTAQDDIAPSLTVEQARAIVAPLYEALNEPTKKDVPALLAKAANPDYRSCSTNSDCLSRDQLAGVFTALGKIVPDLHWTIEDVWTSGNRIVVRGEATGTPTGELFGVKPTGKSFKTISLDMFTVRDGKLATAYHVENWMAALEQIK